MRNHAAFILTLFYCLSTVAVSRGLQPVQPTKYSEVQISLDEKFTLSDTRTLPKAPGSRVEVDNDSKTVKLQLPDATVEQLVDDSVQLTVIRNFILVERGAAPLVASGRETILDSCSGTYHYAYNNDDWQIADNVYWWASPIDLTYLPAEYIVDCIEVHYVVQPSWSFVDVALTFDGGAIYELETEVWGGDGTIEGEKTVTYFNGQQLNKEWYLLAYEYQADGTGYIDSWWIKLYYGQEEGYCSASGGCDEYIANVEFDTIDNSSGCNGYADYTSISNQIMKLDTEFITVTNGNPYSDDECGIWVDWNQDEDFDDAGETITVINTPGTGPYYAEITPSSDVSTGDTRMRVRITWNETPTACGNHSYGEVEDYTITVTAGGPTYGGGSGTDLDPYLIYTPEHLQTLGSTPEHWGKSFKLMDDINLADYTGTDFKIIGTSDFNAFTGHFDGNDNYISNFSYEVSGRSNIGLFGCLSGSAAVIYDLSLINPDVNAVDGQNVGALVGKNLGGAIIRCDVQAGEVRGDDTYYLGGLVGYSQGGDILQCYSTALVYARGYYGGLVGTAETCYIDECYAAGEIDSPRGIPVISPGGLIGENSSSTVTDSYWDIEASGTGISAGGVGKTTEQMYQQSTFTSWDFSSPVWVICEGWYYPRLYRRGFKYAGGKGTSSEPYLIRTPCDMQNIGANTDDWDKHFKLIADINLIDYTGELFNRIGSFFGVFDGDGHSISNFTYSYTGSTQSTIGIFSGVYGFTAEVKNLVIINPNVDSGQNGVFTASLVGKLQNGTVSDCRVQGGSITGDPGFGLAGLVGDMSGGTIVNCDCNIVINPTNGRGGGIVGNMWSGTNATVSGCVFRGQVSGDDGAGGIVGENYGIIENCRVSGQVTAQQQAGGITSENHGIIHQSFCDGQVSAVGSEAGGIAGRNFDNIEDCYSTAQVTAGSTAGGLVGLNWEGNVTRCYAAGLVSGSGGGLIAEVIDGNTLDSFWDIEISGKTFSADGTGLPTSQMYKYTTFDSAGWDLTNTWKVCENETYPKLLWERYSGGDGTKQNPCIICFAEEMQQIGAHREDWEKHFRLADDIDMSAYTGTQYNTIGKFVAASAGGGPFTGSFDGGGHSIYNLSYTTAEKEYGIGLFGLVANKYAPVIIKDLTLVDPHIDVGPGGDSGSLIGIFAYDGEISNCHVVNAVIRGDGGLGGLVGSTLVGSDCKVDRCSASVDIVATSGQEILSGSAGGLVGLNNFALISRSYASGSIVSDGNFVGGLYGFSNGDVNDCYSTVSVNANEYVGGLIGYNGGQVENCYSVGSVSGSGTYVNGLVGLNLGGSVEGCFWDVNTSGQTDPGTGTGLTTAQMQDPNTFLSQGWDFVGEFINGANEIWRLCPDEGEYPVLAWQLPLGDFLCPGGVEENDLGYLCDQWLLREIKLDIAPAGGDGYIDFADWSALAATWRSQSGQPHYNPDCDIVFDGVIDEYDLNEFITYWLETGDEYLWADIFPQPNGDGVIDIYDFALFAQQWMLVY